MPYLAASLATIAGLCLLVTGRPGAATALVVSVVLWLCVVAGGFLTILLEVEDPQDELRDQVRQLHEEARVGDGKGDPTGQRNGDEPRGSKRPLGATVRADRLVWRGN
jgi:hypothetical protein